MLAINPMNEKQREKFLNKIYLWWLIVADIDYFDCGLIYLCNFLRAKTQVVGSLCAALFNVNALRIFSRGVLFPITASASVIYAVFAWITAFVDKENGKFKTEHLIRSVYNTITAINALIATILGLILGAAAGLSTLLLYGTNLVLGSIFQFTTMTYHRYQAYLLNKEIEKQPKPASKENLEKLAELNKEIEKRKGKSLGPLIVGATNILLAISGFVAGTLGVVNFYLLGVAASIAGVIFISYEVRKTLKEQGKEVKVTSTYATLLNKMPCVLELKQKVVEKCEQVLSLSSRKAPQAVVREPFVASNQVSFENIGVRKSP